MTALNKLSKWILDFEKVNGTPTMCEIKAQIEMFKEVEKEQIVQAFEIGYENGSGIFDKTPIYHGSNYYNLKYIDIH